MKFIFHICCAALMGLSMLACGGGSAVVKADTDDSGGFDMPQWVMTQPPLCGVGVSKFRGNIGAAKSSAEDGGRVDLSRQLETKVKSMIQKYIAEGGTADGDFSEEKTTQVSTSLSKTTLRGSAPKQAYLSKKDKQFYSLVCLNPGVLTDAINGMKELGEAQRAALAKRAKVAQVEMETQMKDYDSM
jgi:hypothetical protein